MEYSPHTISLFLKERRKRTGLTQADLAVKAGVGLRFVRDMEQGKNTLRMDKVNQVLKLFGYELGPVPMDRRKFINEKADVQCS
jgi:y4mF family transcriptional regulator